MSINKKKGFIIFVISLVLLTFVTSCARVHHGKHAKRKDTCPMLQNKPVAQIDAALKPSIKPSEKTSVGATVAKQNLQPQVTSKTKPINTTIRKQQKSKQKVAEKVAIKQAAAKTPPPQTNDPVKSDVVSSEPKAEPTKTNYFTKIDEALAKIQLDSVSLDTPKSVEEKETSVIKLSLQLPKEAQDILIGLQQEAQKEGVSINILDRFEGQLMSSDFQVKALDENIQKVSADQANAWKWEISPKSFGTLPLYVTLTANYQVDGVPGRKMLKSYQEQIEVQSPVAVPLKAAKASFTPHLKWIAILIFCIFFIWFIKKRRQLA